MNPPDAPDDTRTDALLVARSRAGDRAAFGRLIERHRERARRVARACVGDEDMARELAHEALLQAYLSLAHLRQDEQFGAWLHGIARNVCHGYLREQKAARRLAEMAAPAATMAATSDPQALLEERERRRTVRDAVNALPPESRVAASLFYYEQRSLREIAGITQASVAAVKGRLHRARRQLRQRLRAEYPELHRTLQKQRRKTMVSITVAGVRTTAGEHGVEQTSVVLLDQAGRRFLSIFIGLAEAFSIQASLQNTPTERPMSMDLAANLLRETGAQIAEVRIEALQNETFLAVVKLRLADQTVREVDARPSDAIALALRMNALLFAATAVLDAGGKDVSAEQMTALAAGDLSAAGGESTEISVE